MTALSVPDICHFRDLTKYESFVAVAASNIKPGDVFACRLAVNFPMGPAFLQVLLVPAVGAGRGRRRDCLFRLSLRRFLFAHK